MELKQQLKKQAKVRNNFSFVLLCLIVGSYGVYIIADTLVDQLASHRLNRHQFIIIDLPILIGISVIYLSTLLRRRKRTAWMVSILAYTVYLGVGIVQLINRINGSHYGFIIDLRSIIFPVLIIGLLIYLRKEFYVKSDIQGFRFALRFILILITVTTLYGTAGFELMDKTDFHQEIGAVTAVHYTVDQFNLTTNKPVQPYTKRAKIFVDSLSFISIVAVIYGILSLFQPLKSRLADQNLYRERLNILLQKYNAPSEEFFKLWPKDKQYYFDDSQESAVAFHVFHGVALCLSDPVGNPERYNDLLYEFNNLCFNNDWLPAQIHVSKKYYELYETNGYTMQLLGQEAIVNIEDFDQNVRQNKYFRNIRNRFKKNGYSFEILKPPHHNAVIDRIKIISDDWLSSGSRDERGYAMGYFTKSYMQMCNIAIARDAAGTIQAFVNIVPSDFDTKEATYDLLRQSKTSLSNINDYILLNLIDWLKLHGYERLNMGLSPLAGMADESNNQKNDLIEKTLKFAYNNGDRFYSFSGLYKFKAKYEPDWHDKYIAYKSGLRGFSRTVTALTRCMSKVVNLKET